MECNTGTLLVESNVEATREFDNKNIRLSCLGKNNNDSIIYDQYKLT